MPVVPLGVAVPVPGPVESAAQLPEDILVALRGEILPLPSTSILDLGVCASPFDE